MEAMPRIWQITAKGNIVNRARETPLPAPVLELAHEVVDFAMERFAERLHSVYLTGDATWDWPSPAIFRIVLRERHVGGVHVEPNEILRLQMRSGYHCDEPVEILLHGWDEVEPLPAERLSRLQVRLAANSRCLAGADLARQVGPIAPDAVLAESLISDYLPFILRMESLAPQVANRQRLRELSRAVALRTLETAFALVMHEEEVYTECVDMMAGFAALHWPERRRSISMAERIARDGVDLSLELSSFIDHHTRWVTDAVRERLARV